MDRVVIASSSQIAADAGAQMAREGGNAVDAAIAAVLVQLVSEPGVVSVGGGAFVTIWPVDSPPLTIDAASEMPGRDLPAGRFGQAALPVVLDYGGGTDTTVGYGSVATPGALAGLELAARQFGRVPWRRLVEPAHGYARDGFLMPDASYRYLSKTAEGIFGWNPESMQALLDSEGSVKRAGETIRVEHLADSLHEIAVEGTRAFYRGEIANRIASDMEAHGGILTRKDLETYAPRILPALAVDVDDWHVATSPPPSVGGAALAAMLLMMRGRPRSAWTLDEVYHLVHVQESIIRTRYDRLDISDDLDLEARLLLERAGALGGGALRAPSTVHTSAVDSNGIACSVTASAGYGSGVMPPGTGIWMNNSLGEVELNRRGFHAWKPGTRIISNMAPTVARRGDGALLAVGSPGADRITTAILQTIVNFAHLGMSLAEAVGHPRLHVEWVDEEMRVAYEPGLPVERMDLPQRCFPDLDMFFGGVSAALLDPPDRLVAAADPRRTGGTALT